MRQKHLSLLTKLMMNNHECGEVDIRCCGVIRRAPVTSIRVLLRINQALRNQVKE